MEQHDDDATLRPAMHWRFPFALRDKQSPDAMQAHFAAMARMQYGFFPLCNAGFPHGGIHFGPAAGEGLELDAGFRCLADGEVIAYRLTAWRFRYKNETSKTFSCIALHTMSSKRGQNKFYRDLARRLEDNRPHCS
jgi:hypothetical protein